MKGHFSNNIRGLIELLIIDFIWLAYKYLKRTFNFLIDEILKYIF